ncbi:hypothetical protein BSL78_16008 [Apostichopus japonicus]|uniref:Protein FAM73B n=1 Tax=Stichopus japonicus TaxID=307972 RepID=A0A2G8KGJ1_STIJA|nr:hypothetical protein BSL78_16008 [Apostichopus japonicus]
MEKPNCKAGGTTRIVAAVVVTTVAGILLAATFFRREEGNLIEKSKWCCATEAREAPERSAASIDSALRYWEEALEMKTTQDGDQQEWYPSYGDELYQAAMIAVRRNQVQCRTNRANMLNCESKEDYLAKVHCIRQALRLLMSDTTMRDWFASMGMQLIADILSTAGYATEDFYVTFEKMMEYVKKPENLTSIEQELRNRKVKDFSFYDAVLDFFLLDAFDDLEDPPASVISIVQNRWLSQSVKETGLGAAIWSVLAAKKQMLKNPRGFMGHCYDISKHVTPALAWGFMGTDEELKGLMNEFKDQVLLFTRSMFSREKCRYSTVAELADDIFALAREIFTTLNQRLSDCPR